MGWRWLCPPLLSQLDPRFTDNDGDLIADTPTDPSAWVDPSVLVFVYTPVKDPAVYEDVRAEFLAHLSKATGKPVQFFPVQSNAAQLEAMRAAYPTAWRKPPQMIKSRGLRVALALGAVIYLVLAIGTIEVNWARVIDGVERAQRFVAGFLQPDFTSRWRDISNGLMESLTMTFTSTVVRETTPEPNVAPRPIRHCSEQ